MTSEVASSRCRCLGGVPRSRARGIDMYVDYESYDQLHFNMCPRFLLLAAGYWTRLSVSRKVPPLKTDGELVKSCAESLFLLCSSPTAHVSFQLPAPRINESTHTKANDIAWLVGSRDHNGTEKKIACPGIHIVHAERKSSMQLVE